MSKQTPFLYRRGDVLNFRIAVPIDLRHCVGCREIVRTLGTSDRAIAAPLALSLAAQAKLLFNRLRGRMGTDTAGGDDLSIGLGFEIDLDEMGLPKRISVQAEPHEEDAAKALIRTAIESSAQARSRMIGGVEGRSFQKNAPDTQQNAGVPTLKTVIEDFLIKYAKRNKPAMLKKHQQVLPMLLEMVGNKPVLDIRQADINNFFELLDKLPPRWADACRRTGLSIRQLAEQDHDVTLGPKAFEDTYLASVRPFLKAAKKDWQDQGFPTGLTTDGIEYLGDREEGECKQRALKLDELKHLFTCTEYKAFADDSTKAHCYWLPLVGLFTGARVNEICQLNPQVDIYQDQESGVWCFWITKETESDPRVRKSVKTGDSRKVPIHKKLIELGFLKYLDRIKKSGAKLLFPAWEPINYRASGNAEKWFRQFLMDTELRDETPKAMILGMHAFRHTILTYGAMQKPPLSLFCITGHAQEEAPIHATGSGKGYLTLSLLSPLSERAALLNDLDYGLDFAKPVST